MGIQLDSGPRPVTNHRGPKAGSGQPTARTAYPDLYHDGHHVGTVMIEHVVLARKPCTATYWAAGRTGEFSRPLEPVAAAAGSEPWPWPWE